MHVQNQMVIGKLRLTKGATFLLKEFTTLGDNTNSLFFRF